MANSSASASKDCTNLDTLKIVLDSSPFPMVLIDSYGTIAMANWSAESLLCYEPQQLTEQPIESLFSTLAHSATTPHGTSPFIQLWRGSLEKQQELTALRKDGNQFPVEVSLHPRQTTAGLHLLVTLIDATERKWAKSEFNRLSLHQQYILQSAGEGIYGLNLNGQLTFINPAGANMVGWKAEEILGQPQHTAFEHGRLDKPCLSSDACHIVAAFRDSAIHHVDDEVFWRKDGSCFPVEYTSTPLHDETDRVIGAVVTFRDITQRKLMEKADHDLRVMKDEFIATASHELKTPIASLRGFMKLILHGKVTDPVVQQEFLARANQDVERLLTLVHNLLDTSKLETGVSQFLLEDVELKVMVTDTFETLAPLAKNKEIRLQQELPSEPIVVKVDRQAFQRVLENLLSNAIKFSDLQRPVLVTGKHTADGTVIHVIDHGPGFPQEEATRLFEKFYQAKSLTKRADGGSGLGLFIAKKIIEGHGGQISVESTVGQGATFTISLPTREITTSMHNEEIS
ncbi:PAS domain-containing sensor histidine kinase [Nitrospira sp. M1]